MSYIPTCIDGGSAFTGDGGSGCIGDSGSWCASSEGWGGLKEVKPGYISHEGIRD